MATSANNFLKSAGVDKKDKKQTGVKAEMSKRNLINIIISLMNEGASYF